MRCKLSAITMAARKFFFFLIKSNLDYTRFIRDGPQFSSQTTPSPTKHFSVNHSLTSTMIIPPYVCVKSCTIPP